MTVLYTWLLAADFGDVLLCLAFLFALVGVAVFFIGSRDASRNAHKKKEMELLDAVLFELTGVDQSNKEIKTINLSQLSVLWRNPQPVQNNIVVEQEKKDPVPTLQHPRAQAFMEKLHSWDWFKKSPLHRAMCEQILMLIDREGDCPSVVNITGDVEGNWNENMYQRLARITLLDHSLNVAEQAITLLSQSIKWYVMIPDTIVAALSHDLGKLVSQRELLYFLGEHAIASGRPLAKLPNFKLLAKKKEILQAVKQHHKTPADLLGKILKKADQLARQQELKEEVLEEKEEVKVTQEQKETETTPSKPKVIDISAWFNATQFLNELKPYINTMVGRNIQAFSMPNGIVYIHAQILEKIARQQANLMGYVEDQVMHDIMLSIIQSLRVKHNAIVHDLILDSFFGNYFIITFTNKSPKKGFFTPFHANVFGSIDEMEQTKPDPLREIQTVSLFSNSKKKIG